MAIISKTVNKTAVTGSEMFVYTVKASFSHSTEEVFSGTLEEFFPSNIQYTLPPVDGNLQDIRQTEVEGGTIVVFDYGEVTSGTVVEFSVGASFGEGRKNGDVFTNEVILYQNGEQTVSATSDAVTLTLVSDFRLLKYNMTSEAQEPGGTVAFRLVLKNYGDPGATIEDITITDTIPDILVADLNYEVVGADQSASFPDDSQNQNPVWDGKTISFYLSSYSGEEFVMDFWTQVDLRVEDGTTATNTATWTVAGEEQTSASADVTTFIEKAETSVLLKGSSHGVVGGEIQFEVHHANVGTVPITDYVLTEIIPEDFILERIRCQLSADAMKTYSIYITSSEDTGVEILVAEDISDSSRVFDVLAYVNEGYVVSSVIWKTSEVFATSEWSVLYLQGTISETAVENSSMENIATLTGNSSLGSLENKGTLTTYFTNKSVLEVTKGLVEEDTAYYPLEEFYFYMEASGANGQTVEPIFADLLPIELVYVAGNEYYVYYDAFSGTYYDSRVDDFPLSLPVVTVIEDYDGTGRTLVRYSFLDETLLYQNTLKVYGTVAVAVGASDGFVNYAYLGNPTDDAIVVGTAYLDTMDLDGDTYTDEYIAQSIGVSGTILYTSEFSIDKYVQGDLDIALKQSGNTTQGGTAVYELQITNNQDAQLSQLDVVDILPHIGDTGVIFTGESRGSQFPVYLASTVSAQVVNLLSGDENTEDGITVAYSTSYDPVRFSLSDGEIGTGTWVESVPDDLTQVASLRVTTDDSLILEPYERLVIRFTVETPSGVPEGDVAYNSFAVKGDVTKDETSSSLVPTEPEKVSLTMAQTITNSIGSFVWDDVNDNGIWDEGEVGVNGVTVELYDSTGTLLETRITADDYTGESGYYLFSDLSAGEYQVKFIPETGDSLTIQNLESPEGSKPDPETGFTALFTLSEGEQLIDINAGLASYTCGYPVITANNQTLIVNTVFDVMSAVSAVDCDGNDITDSIVVIFDDVDTSVAGVYTVTYEVTDQYEQSAEKTITVTVITEAEAREQAVNDLLTSIALEESGIQSILHGEGAKIQKAVALNLSSEEMLAVNTSVESMVRALTNLETALARKLEFTLGDLS